jgi:hypothetical protein
VLEAYGVARAVVIPAGHHRIVMRFRPPSIVLGCLMTGFGFAAMAGLLWL